MTTLTPADLSQAPSTTEFHLPAYDWNKQTRHDTIITGSYSTNSVQTFNHKGQPNDSRSDNND